MSLCAAAPSLTRAGAVRSVGTKGLVAVRPCRRTVVKVQALMSPENKGASADPACIGPGGRRYVSPMP